MFLSKSFIGWWAHYCMIFKKMITEEKFSFLTCSCKINFESCSLANVGFNNKNVFWCLRVGVSCVNLKQLSDISGDDGLAWGWHQHNFHLWIDLDVFLSHVCVLVMDAMWWFLLTEFDVETVLPCWTWR